MKHLYRKGLLFLGLLAAFTLSYGQTVYLNDNFDDGDIVGWTEGASGDWVSSTDAPITGTNALKHNLTGVGGTSYISHPVTAADLTSEDFTWQLQLKNGSWDPSSGNKFWFFLVANESELTSATVDGYAVGVNLTGFDDLLTLWKVTDGEADVALITSSLDWNSGTLAGIQVTRSSLGAWELSIDSDGGFDALISAGSASNTDYTTFSNSGLEFTYSSTRAGFLWMDDVLIEGAAPATNTVVQFASTSETISEGAGTYDLVVSIINEDASVATSVDVVTDVAGTPVTLGTATFPAASAVDQNVQLTIDDDSEFLGTQTLVLELANVSGGNAAEIGLQSSFELTSIDNDPVTIPYAENFDTDLNGVYTFSVASDAVWTYENGVAAIGGFGANEASEDWLILPEIDLTTATNPIFTFESWTRFTDAIPGLSVLASSDYSGFGDPTGATWTDLSPTLPAQDTQTFTSSGSVDLSTYIGGGVFIAFVFESTGTGGGETTDWEVDNILVKELAPEPTNHVTAFTNDPAGFGSVNLTWDDNAGAQAADGFLIKYSAVSAGDIVAPVDGTPEADGEGTFNVSAGVGTALIEELAAETQYFFNIYPYTNAGVDVDYKTDGTVPTLSATTISFPTLFVTDDLEYGTTAGDLTAVSGGVWNAHSGAGTGPIQYSVDNLDLSGYTPSAVGGSIAFGGGSEDVNQEFTTISSGSVYLSALINVSSAPGSPDYFFHMRQASGSFKGRFYAQDDAGTLRLGIGKNSATMSTDAFEFGKTYLVVIKYTFNEGTADDDVVELFVSDEYSATENTPILSVITDGTDATDLNQVAFRQGSVVGSADRIRVASNWEEAVGAFVDCRPTTPPSVLDFANIAETTLDVSWTAGDGDAALVLIKEGGPVDAEPTSGTAYTADAAFAAGQELGTGNFVLFAGAGNTVAVTGLTSGTEYHFAVYEYNSTDNCYNLTSLTGSQFTVTPNDEDSDIVAGDPQIAAGSISSLAIAEQDAVDVFAFDVVDAGTADGIPTILEGVVIEPGAGNTASWSTELGGAMLSDGVTAYMGVVTDTDITFDLSTTPVSIADNSANTFTLSVWLETSVGDDGVLEFEVPVDHQFTFNGVDGSLLKTTLDAAVTSNQQVIDVTATAFELDFPLAVNLAEDFSLAVSAVDANGNIDEAARAISISKTSGAGNLSSATGLTAQAMTLGVYLWTDLQLDAADNYVLTIDDDGSALTAVADIQALTLVDAPAQILITEVVVTPTDGEYIEIYNNSQDVIALGNYYLTDATFAGGDTYYYNIVSGANAGGGGFGDWFARFPSDAIIQPGEVQTVSLTGSEAFFTTYGILPTYELFEDGAETDEIPDMLEATAGSIAGQGGLTNGGEIVMLFYWDGLSDLVTDIDYVMWGDQAEAIDKTGISIDGPDADTEASTYLDDLPTASQALISATTHADGSSWQRLDYEEGTELSTGGNGVDGNNEMTENLGDTFFEFTANPGEIIEPGSALITLNTESFVGAFGFIELGQTSEASMYSIIASGLVNDLVITPPVGFEVAGEMDFSGTIYTDVSPWTISPDMDDSVNQVVYVRFTPLAVDEQYSGEINHASVGAISNAVAVSGFEGVFDTAPNLSGVVINEVLPDPNGSQGFNYDTDGSGGAETADEFVEIYNSSDAAVDISGWQLWDEAGLMHEFPASSILGAGNYAAVMAAVQTGGSLPTPSEGNLAFEASASMSISNSGENIALYNPNTQQYIQMLFNEDAEYDFASDITGASAASITEDWGSDVDGTSMVREPAGTVDVVIHGNIQGAEAASFAEPTIDPNAPAISADLASFTAAFGNVVIGEESAISTYSVSAINLSSDLLITAPTGFQVSSDGTTFGGTVTLSPTNQEVAATTITVKYVPTSEGSEDGVISHTSTGASTIDLDVSGAGITESTIFFEGFGSCDALNGFTAQSVSGDNVWECSDSGNPGGAAAMSGFDFGTFTGVVNEDWLVSPEIDLSAVGAAQLSFDTDVAFDGTGTLTVQYSIDYTNDVTTAQWTELDATFDVYDAATENDGVFVSSGDLDIPGGSTVYLAFKYVSEDDANGAVEYRVDNILVTERQAEWVVNTTGFVGNFGTQDVGTQSVGVPVAVEGFALTADATVTAPAQFELALSSDFAEASTSLTLSPVGGVISEEVFIRFAPTASGEFSGNVVFTTTGFDDVSLAVSGTGVGDDPTLSIEDDLAITVYPNPVQNVFKIANKTGKQLSVKLFSLDGSEMNIKRQGEQYNIGSLNSGVYILVVRDVNDNELARRQIIKN